LILKFCIFQFFFLLYDHFWLVFLLWCGWFPSQVMERMLILDCRDRSPRKWNCNIYFFVVFCFSDLWASSIQSMSCLCFLVNEVLQEHCASIFLLFFVFQICGHPLSNLWVACVSWWTRCYKNIVLPSG